MNKTYIIGGEIVVAIALIVATWFFFTLNNPNSSTGGQHATSTPTVYHSQEAGIEFTYPSTYKLEERTDGFEGKTIKILNLIDKNVVIPDMSEGPPMISLLIIPNPENLVLDQWVRAKSISNYHLSSGGEMGASTIDNQEGLGYIYDGLYQNTAIAVAYKGKIYLFTVGTLTPDDQIKIDFFKLLDSVKFL